MILPAASRGIGIAHMCAVPGTDPPEYIHTVTSLADCDAAGGVDYMHLTCGILDDMLGEMSLEDPECPSKNSRKYALSDSVTRV